jgi:hypothetical protein
VEEEVKVSVVQSILEPPMILHRATQGLGPNEVQIERFPDTTGGSQEQEKKTVRRQRVQINTENAFEFLTRLKPGSVDLIVSSPPYCIGKEYERSVDTIDFLVMHERISERTEARLRRHADRRRLSRQVHRRGPSAAGRGL